jgi:hypothetical protein
MKRFSCLLFAVVFVAGCGGLPEENETVDGVGLANSQVDLLKGVDDVDPAAWLTLPREELARRCVELEKNIAAKDQLLAHGQLVYALLKENRWPSATPVFREATYRPGVGISLPAYVSDGVKDSVIAEHLDRFGDHEAAALMVDPSDEALVAKIAVNRTKINFPVEWTRLVALTEQASQIDLASDNFEGAKRLIAVQRKLRALFNEETKNSPLGAALLNRGLSTLKQAAAAWQASGRIDLGQQTLNLIGEFGETPAWSPTLPKTPQALAGFFAPGSGPGLVAVSPMRTLDLLDLPLPHDSADTAAAFVDAKGDLVEILIDYRPVLEAQQLYKAEQFAGSVEEMRASHAEDLGVDFPRRVWDLPECQMCVTLTRRNDSIGAVATVRTPKFLEQRFSGGTLPRDLGTVSLDRTFEANRRLSDWKKRASTLVLSEKAIKDVTNPLPTRTPTRIELVREVKGIDLLGSAAFEFSEPTKTTSEALGEIARPLFASLGRPIFDYRNEGRGPTVDVKFRDAETAYVLSFPQHRSQPISLVIADVSTKPSAERETAARAQDLKDRTSRMSAGSPLKRLPRSLEGIELGMTKAEFLKALPDLPQLSKRDLPGGAVMASFLGTPASGDAVVREWFGRFEADRLVELRIRYADVPNNRPGTFHRKLDALKAECGAAESIVTPSAWTDLAAKSTVVRLGWQDDVTVLIVRQEPFGLEATLRDCPLDHPEGTPMPPLEYLSRGTSHVTLGMSKEQIAKLNPKLHEGTWLISPSAGDPYDAILVWMEKDHVARIVARSKQAAMPPRNKPEAARSLLEGWARDGSQLGWPTRQDVVGGALESLGSRDDRTRFRRFWREDRNGVALFSEWREMPAAP